MELKDRIIEEASYLFFHNGIRSITMSDIANHMGISKRTLYEVFQDKEELLGACIDYNSEKANQEISQIVAESDNVIDTLMRIYAKHLNDVHKTNKSVIHDLRKYHPALYKKIECKHKEGIDTFIPLFDRGIQQGLLSNEINPEILLWLLKSQFRSLMEGDFIPIEKYSIEEFVRAIILTFTRGIATTKGNQKIDELIENLKNKQRL